jgi:DNA-binding NtrC family response regulator
MQEEKKSPVCDDASQNPLVLIFSKDEDCRLLLKTLLEIWNYKVIEIANEEELLRTAAESNPSLILLDLTIAFAKDVSFIRNIHENSLLANLPVVVISGHTRPQHSAYARAMGAADYIVKPIDFERLETSLKTFTSEDRNFMEISLGSLL